MIVVGIGGLGVSFASTKRAVYEGRSRRGNAIRFNMSFMLSVVYYHLGHAVGPSSLRWKAT